MPGVFVIGYSPRSGERYKDQKHPVVPHLLTTGGEKMAKLGICARLISYPYAILRVMNTILFFEKRSNLFWGIVGVASVILLGIIDYLTGYELSFSLFYLAPISLIAWFKGRRFGLVISAISAIAWFLADYLSGILCHCNLAFFSVKGSLRYQPGTRPGGFCDRRGEHPLFLRSGENRDRALGPLQPAFHACLY